MVTLTTARRRHFSASPWHNGKKGKGEKQAKGAKPAKGAEAPSKPTLRYKWASRTVSHELYDVLESHILDSNLFASERFPIIPAGFDSHAGSTYTKKGVPKTLNPHNPENEMPPFAPYPDEPRPHKTYDAIAIDCEMVSIRGREQGLVHIAAVDFFTGDIVLRSLVRPGAGVTDWRRRVTGVDKDKLMEAVKKGRALRGWEEVRERLFDVTTSETIFIGHALANDLRVLRIATDRVVDSMMIMSRAVYGDARTFPRNWGLKTACQQLLDVDVQATRGTHDAVEDALATRELVLQFVRNPEKLEAWAARIRGGLTRVVEKEQAKEEAKRLTKARRAEERKSKSPEQLAQEAAEKARVKEENKIASIEKRVAAAAERLRVKKERKAGKKARKAKWEADAAKRARDKEEKEMAKKAKREAEAAERASVRQEKKRVEKAKRETEATESVRVDVGQGIDTSDK